MWLVLIQVECYSGGKADESPRRFLWEDRWVEVGETVDRWYQGHPDPEWPISDYFKVTDRTGRRYLIKHDRESDSWHMAKVWDDPL